MTWARVQRLNIFGRVFAAAGNRCVALSGVPAVFQTFVPFPGYATLSPSFGHGLRPSVYTVSHFALTLMRFQPMKPKTLPLLGGRVFLWNVE